MVSWRVVVVNFLSFRTRIRTETMPRGRVREINDNGYDFLDLETTMHGILLSSDLVLDKEQRPGPPRED